MVSMYHHKSLKRFHLEGTIADDSLIYRIKQECLSLLVEKMRGQGYAVRIDIDPDFTIEYDEGVWKFEVSVYGVYVGRKRALCIDYLDGYKPHMKKAKSTQPLPQRELM